MANPTWDIWDDWSDEMRAVTDWRIGLETTLCEC